MSASTLGTSVMDDEDSETGDSHRQQEEARKHLLLQLEQTLSSITTDHERLKVQCAGKLNAIAAPALARIQQYSSSIDEKCVNFANVLGRTNEGFQKEVETLKDEMKSLVSMKEKLTNKLDEMKIKQDEREENLQRIQKKLDIMVGQESQPSAAVAAPGSTAWFDNELGSNVELIRITRALQKALETIDGLRKQLAGQGTA